MACSLTVEQTVGEIAAQSGDLVATRHLGQGMQQVLRQLPAAGDQAPAVRPRQAASSSASARMRSAIHMPERRERVANRDAEGAAPHRGRSAVGVDVLDHQHVEDEVELSDRCKRGAERLRPSVLELDDPCAGRPDPVRQCLLRQAERPPPLVDDQAELRA